MDINRKAFNGTKQIMLIFAPYLGPEILNAKDEQELKEILTVPELQGKAEAIQLIMKATLEL